jgi:hypothetical protein
LLNDHSIPLNVFLFRFYFFSNQYIVWLFLKQDLCLSLLTFSFLCIFVCFNFVLELH